MMKTIYPSVSTEIVKNQAIVYERKFKYHRLIILSTMRRMDLLSSDCIFPVSSYVVFVKKR